MTEELLNEIKFTGVYIPKDGWSKGYMDTQHYGFCMPFIVGENIVMIDTYHISFYGKYEGFVKEREQEREKQRQFIPYVTDYYYQHYKVVRNVKDLQRDFKLICDLKEYHPVESRVYAQYRDEDRLDGIRLWFECQYFQGGYMLVKNDAKIFYGRNIMVLLNGLKNDTCNLLHSMSTYDLDKVKEAIEKAESEGSWYDKEFYERILKWNDFLIAQTKIFNEEYKKVFGNRRYACEKQEDLDELKKEVDEE